MPRIDIERVTRELEHTEHNPVFTRASETEELARAKEIVENMPLGQIRKLAVGYLVFGNSVWDLLEQFMSNDFAVKLATDVIVDLQGGEEQGGEKESVEVVRAEIQRLITIGIEQEHRANSPISG